MIWELWVRILSYFFVLDQFGAKVEEQWGWSRSYQTFFSLFFFFGVKLGHFTINNFFLYVTKMQAYKRKTEKFFVSEEKKFGRIDSWK